MPDAPEPGVESVTMEERELEAVKLLCKVLVGTGKYLRASDLLSGLARQVPGDAWIERNLVLSLVRLGKFEDALPVARVLAGKAADGDKVPALFFHAYALWGCGKTEESRRVVEEYSRELARCDGRDDG